MSEVIVIGGANIDIKAKADRDLIAGSSNPGSVSFAAGGVARNIAHNLAKLDVPVALISAVGKDALGSDMLAQTESAGVDVSMVLHADMMTGSYVAVLDADGEMSVSVNAMPAMDALLPKNLKAHARRIAAASMVVADCNIAPVTLTWLSLLTSKLLVEPVSIAKSHVASVLFGKTIFAITPNRGQAQSLTQIAIKTPIDGIEAAVYLHDQGFRNVVVTLGTEGAIASCKGRSAAHVEPLRDAIAVDVTGAGDAATAGLIFGLLENLDLADAARLGQAAAALTIASPDTVSRELTRARLLSLAAARKDTAQ